MVFDRYKDSPDADARAHLAASVTAAILAIAMGRWLADGGTADLGEEIARCTGLLGQMVAGGSED